MVSAIHLTALVLSGVLLKPAVLWTSGDRLPNFLRAPDEDLTRLIFPAECRQEIRQVRSVLECSVMCGQSGLDCVAFIAYIHTNRLVSCEIIHCWLNTPSLEEVTQAPTLQLPYDVHARTLMCPPNSGTTPAGKRCYRLFKNRLNFMNAMDACSANGMILAEPDTVYQAHALLAWLELQDLDKDDQVMTNLIHYNGEFVSNSMEFSFKLWASGQPDGDGNCVTAMMETGKYRFNDFPCSSRFFYVCEGVVRAIPLQV